MEQTIQDVVETPADVARSCTTVDNREGLALASCAAQLSETGHVGHFGFGSGKIAAALGKRGRVTSFLPDEPSVRAARQRFEGSALSFVVAQEGLTDPDLRFDVVVVETTGEELAIDPKRAMQLLSEGGHLVFVGRPVAGGADELLPLGTFAWNAAEESVGVATDGDAGPFLSVYQNTELTDVGLDFPDVWNRGARATAEIFEPAVDLYHSDWTTACHIEFTSNCNLRCVYCKVSQPWYQARDFDMSRFDEIVETLKQRKIKTILVNGHGETTMVKDWHQYVSRLFDTGGRLHIISNFARDLEPEEVEVLSRFTGIEVSADTADPELLARLRRKVQLKNILHNIAKVRAAAFRDGREAPRFSWSIVVSDHSVFGLRETISLGIAAGVRHFTMCHLTENEKIEGVLAVRPACDVEADRLQEAKDAILDAEKIAEDHEAQVFVMPALLESIDAKLAGDEVRTILTHTGGKRHYVKKPEGHTKDCLDPWRMGNFKATGRVLMCCWHHDNYGTLGDKQLPELLNSPPAVELRRRLITGELDQSCEACPARGWIPVEELREKVAGFLRTGTPPPQKQS